MPASTQPVEEEIDLQLDVHVIRSGTVLHTIYEEGYSSTSFNPGSGPGKGRFHPLRPNGAVVSTLYLSDSFSGAMCEKIFRVGCSKKEGNKFTVPKQRLLKYFHGIVEVKADISVLDLSGYSLRRLGDEQVEILHGGKDKYSETAKIAENLYLDYPNADGLVWASKQIDTEHCYVVFNPRKTCADFDEISGTRLFDGSKLHPDLYALARSLGITLTDNN